MSEIEQRRIDPCSCGSGKRYKHCHGAFPAPWNDILEKGFQAGKARHDAEQARRRHQQGHGKPIISAKLGDVQFVGVGNSVRYGTWKTFEDFLDTNLKLVFGKHWADKELAKPENERHPLFSWIAEYARQLDLAPAAPSGIKTMKSVGAHSAYFGLAYNLYLLQHNSELKRRLLRRLRLRSEFHGAYYETCVAATCILAGLKLELEDEGDASSTHCEFYAVEPVSGRKFWVEAKSRSPGKDHTNIRDQLYKAFKKSADVERIVFVDLNVRDETLDETVADVLTSAVRECELTMTIDGQPTPKAFIFVTNFPAHLNIQAKPPRRMIVPLGFKRPEFGVGVGYRTVEEAFKAKRAHAPLYLLMDRFKAYSIPSTFDGEIPQFSFGTAKRRWVVGEEYTVGDTEGLFVLESGIVLPESKEAALVFKHGGDLVIHRDTLSDAELEAYNAHPETFFSILDRNARKERPETQLEWFEFAYSTYKDTAKEQLLEFMKDAPNIEELRELDQDELAIRYCGGFARGACPGSH
ncbi:SEC-C domain-containing protein [Pseudoxanthomonas sp. SE1]|uniref:SEC-C domain-containing protein n=1 Tax=Pseudoxanthomonas sp. SE1 TaxID=1664560 RepID=UPI00240CFD51|nr:SEC-C domain-containing protein [Pseudoxanthomonas sp. SE1]WFC41741.1 SEC-C domain-containing protein [Pseudoxanthomonas sp. SE1]